MIDEAAKIPRKLPSQIGILKYLHTFIFKCNIITP